MELHKCKLISDVAIFSDGDVLLLKYKNDNKYDHQEGWFLPDDILEDGEHPEEAAIRILKEQLNLSNINPILNHIESFTGKDNSWHMVFHYKAEIALADEIRISKDIIEYDWFNVKNLPDKKEIAHNGWAMYTIRAITGIANNN